MQTGTGAGASVFGILKNTLATEGTRGLYRGVSAPLIAVSPIYAISFWGYDIGQRIVRLFHPHDSPFTIPELCVAGGISALPSTALMAPTERIKCLLQVQTHSHGKPQYSGMIDCARQVFQKGGVPSLYKGTGLTLMRDVPGSIAWFGVYEVCKKQMVVLTGVRDVAQLSPLSIMVSGGFAGMACWSVSIPADVLKSRYQTAPDGKYHGIGDVYRTLMREEGPTALFTGIRPAMIRAFPANAACFLGMEMARKSLAFLD
jgi:solute carrier family 25 carnitine/acylcarnitine transporter 20/29